MRTNHFSETVWAAGRARAFSFGIAAMVALLFGLLVITARPAHAATFTVDSTGNGGDVNLNDAICDADARAFETECTLRAALQEANDTPGADTIDFNIPGNGPHTISPTQTSALPTITDTVTINGYTQPGATPNTQNLQSKTNANPLVELDGTNAGNTPGLTIGDNASSSLIKGLIINDFGREGIFFNESNSTDVTIEGNFIGVNSSGVAEENSLAGVFLFNTSDVTIGGLSKEARNLISGNSNSGVKINGTSSKFNKVQGNLIGTDKNGTGDQGNTQHGVEISSGASDNLIGGDDDTAGDAENPTNTIAFNDQDGVFVNGDASIGNSILRNSIFSNGQLGIDLNGGTTDSNGATANDKKKDSDTGPNNLQNFPEITSATISGGQGITITGRLKSNRIQPFTIQFFRTADGEGKVFLGETTVITNGKGIAPFTFNSGVLLIIDGNQDITATATNLFTGDTSELSGAKTLVQDS